MESSNLDRKNALLREMVVKSEPKQLKLFLRCLSSEEYGINKKDQDGNTALHTACKERSLEVVEQLCDSGADVNVKNNTGDTPLHLSCSNQVNAREIIQYLIAKNASLDAKNSDGQCAKDMVLRYISEEESSSMDTLGSRKDEFRTSPLSLTPKAPTGVIEIAQFLQRLKK